MNRLNLLIIACMLGGTLTSCLKTPAASKIPEIAFRGFSTGDTIDPALGNHARFVKLTIDFKDGDGDVGLDKSETSSPYDLSGGYYYNMVATYYKLVNGEFVKQSDEGARIPKLSEYANKHGLRGTITQDFVVLEPSNETIRFDVFIYDRALNKSNVIRTPDIVLH